VVTRKSPWSASPRHDAVPYSIVFFYCKLYLNSGVAGGHKDEKNRKGKVEQMTALRISIAMLFGALSLLAQSFPADLGATEEVFRIRPFQSAINSNLAQQPENGTQGTNTYPLSQPQFNMNGTQATGSRPKAVTYSNAYSTRARIHKYASIATLPLFAAEAVVGQRLFNKNSSESGSLRSAHSGLAAGIGVLFGVNTLTGVWNMMEARKDPNGHRRRLIHGLLMLGADAGFVATAALAPHHDHEGFGSNDDASTHRAVAFSSLGVATIGYVYMLLAK
jgi:hypothetical protein